MCLANEWDINAKELHMLGSNMQYNVLVVEFERSQAVIQETITVQQAQIQHHVVVMIVMKHLFAMAAPWWQ